MGTSVQVHVQREHVYLVPPGENKCVLMTAGLVAYKLCNRGYDCEHCPFYQAFREGCVSEQCPEDVRQHGLYLRLNLSREIARAGLDDPRLATLLKPYEHVTLRRRLFYAPGHAWVEIRTLNQARIGADDFLALALPRIDGIIPPEKGQRVERGKPLVWFIVHGEMLPLLSPLAGTIIKTNAKVLTNPSLLQRDPYGDGWLVEIETADLPAATRGLEYDEDSAALFRQDAENLFSELAAALTGREALVGIVSQDGGQPAATPVEALGAKRYARIFRKVLERSAARLRESGSSGSNSGKGQEP